MAVIVNKAQISDFRESDLVEHYVCGICGGKLSELDDYIPEMRVRFASCPRCGAFTYNRIACQAYMDRMYSNYDDAYDWYNVGETDAVTFSEPLRMAKHIYRYIHKEIHFSDTLRILDFGGGSGVFAYKLAELLLNANICKNVNITVVDYLDALYQDDGVRQIRMKHAFPIQSVKERGFHIIIASAIIEHLPNPSEELGELFSRLSEKGFFYCRMPYARPLFLLAKRLGIQYDMLYPGHIWDFPPEWFEKLHTVIDAAKTARIVVSRPSIPETTLRSHFVRAVLTRLFKAPWYLFHNWPFVGGWEAIYQKM
jgi:2-polyprenyl-3-methyl-5-hydroxy-6-metoxy-1,4-benzoquinol methylase